MKQVPAPAHPIVLGKVGKTHGVSGWVKLYSHADPPENLLQYSDFLVAQGHNWNLLEMDAQRIQGKALLAHFQGYDTPETARELTGLELAIEAQQLPELQSEEFYWYQLQGLEVVNHHQQRLGKVTRLLETGANDVLVVAPDANSIDAHERLIPFVRGEVVTGVELELGRLLVNWEADYLV